MYLRNSNLRPGCLPFFPVRWWVPYSEHPWLILGSSTAATQCCTFIAHNYNVWVTTGNTMPHYASEDTTKNTVIPLLGWEVSKGLRRLSLQPHPQKLGKSSDTTKIGLDRLFLQYFNKQNSQAKSLVSNKWKRTKLPLQCFGGTLFFNEHCVSGHGKTASVNLEEFLSRYTAQPRPRAGLETTYTLPAGRDSGVWQH